MQSVLGLKAVELAKKLGIDPSTISQLKGGKAKGKGLGFWAGIHLVFPEWAPYLRGETENPPTKHETMPYEQEKEHILPHLCDGPGRDMGFTVVKVIDPGDAVYIRKVEEIFKSAEPGAALALKSNIDQFYDKVLNQKKIEERLSELSGRVARLQASIGELLTSHQPPEGTEERRESFIQLKNIINEGNGGSKI